MGRRSGALLLAFALVACSGHEGAGDDAFGDDADDAAADGPAASVVDDRTDITAAELAPSQVTASTVARPHTPPPCDPGDLVWWTAQVVHVGASGTATLRVRNDGERWCEVDIGSSPGVSPEVESNVWLEPGEWADLLVGSAATGCPAEVVREIDLVLGGATSIAVPTGMVVECGVALMAFYVAEPASGPCASLTAAITDGSLLVRNDDFVSCELGELVGAEGVEIGDASEDSLVDITVLAGGDVVAFDLQSAPGADCSEESATLEFATAGELTVPGTGRCATVVLGSGRPVIDGVGGPLAAVDDGDIDGALAALDPFG
jgi:hypothetical protein